MITHNPDIDLLVDYASGSLAEPLALIVACHVVLCESCRDRSQKLDKIGGVLIGEIEPVAMSGDALARVMERLDAPESPPHPALAVLDTETRRTLPSPLWRYIDKASLSQCRWRRLTPAMREIRLATSVPTFRTSLFKVRPGGSIPPHRHRGHEYTLVLTGGLSNEDGEPPVRGDVALADATCHHVQVADASESCLCLTVLDAPVRLTGPLGFFLNPFLRF